MYFQALRYLYLQYNAKQISRKQGQIEKQKLALERDRLARESESILSYSKYYADVYTSLARVSSTYAKERTLAHADEMYQALYHVRPISKNEEQLL